MKIQWKLLILCIAIPLAVGGLAAFFSGGGMQAYESIQKPSLSPPAWLFPVVWTILYTLMGISSYLILKSEACAEQIRGALDRYVCQLAVNFLWPILFFSFEWYLVSFFWLLLLLGLAAWMITTFAGISKTAAYFNIPYLVWLVFAAYLNFMVWRMNI